jgi:hypothetical protein
VQININFEFLKKLFYKKKCISLGLDCAEKASRSPSRGNCTKPKNFTVKLFCSASLEIITNRQAGRKNFQTI